MSIVDSEASDGPVRLVPAGCLPERTMVGSDLFCHHQRGSSASCKNFSRSGTPLLGAVHPLISPLLHPCGGPVGELPSVKLTMDGHLCKAESAI